MRTGRTVLNRGEAVSFVLSHTDFPLVDGEPIEVGVEFLAQSPCCVSATIDFALSELDLTLTRISLIDGFIPVTGVLTTFALQFMNSMGQATAIRGSGFSISSPNLQISCPGANETLATALICSFFTQSAGPHVFLVRVDALSGQIGPVVVFSFAGIITGAVLIGVIALVLLLLWARRLYLRRREHLISNILKNYASLGRSSGDPSVGDLIDRSLLIKFEDIEVLRDISSGASARVMLCIWRRTKVAVKQYYGLTEREAAEFIREVGVHKGLRHPNIVQLIGDAQRPPLTAQESCRSRCVS